MKRKSSRRSSILKLSRPLEDIQNISSDDRALKKRRVSFANVVDIREFSQNQQTRVPENVLDDAPKALSLQAANEEDAETVVQISTPRGKKRRRISADSGSHLERLSIIPKLEQSFCLTDDFEVYEDAMSCIKPGVSDRVLEDMCTATGTSIGFPLDEKNLDDNLNEGSDVSKEMQSTVTPLPLASMSKQESCSVSMEMTLQSSEQQMSNFSFLSPDDLLRVSLSSKVATHNSKGNSSLPTMNTESRASLSAVSASLSRMDFTCVNGLRKDLSQSATLPLDRSNHLHLEFTDLSENNFGEQSLSPFVEKDASTSDLHCNESASSSNCDNADKLELTCDFSVGNDKTSMSLCDPDQVSHNASASNVSDNLDHTYCLSKPTNQMFLPIFHESENMEQLQSSGTVLSKNNEQFSFQMKHDACSANCSDFLCRKSKTSQEKQEFTSCVSLSNDTHGPKSFAVTQENKAVLANVSRREDCDDWLDGNVDSDTFLLEEDMSPPSHCKPIFGNSPSSVSSPLITSTSPVSSSQKVTPITIFSTGLRKLMEGKEELVLEPPVIETPDALPIVRGNQARWESSSNATKSFKATDSLVSIENVSTVQACRSFLPSPSGYSKFCGILNCDQTVIDHSYCGVPCSSSVSSISENQDGVHVHALDGTSFCDFLKLLKASLKAIGGSLEVRLNDARYTDAHAAVSPSLRIILNAVFQALCALDVLISYGEISGLSKAAVDCQDCSPPHSNELESCEDITGSLKSKVNWISEVNVLLRGHVYPMVEQALGYARDIYSWELGRWNNETVELTLSKDYHVVLGLSPIRDIDLDAPVLTIVSVNINPLDGFSKWMNTVEQCTTTAEIAKAVYHVQEALQA